MGDAPRAGWVISDGRRGIENQALGLAEACGRLRPLDIQCIQLSASPAFKALPPRAQRLLKPRPQSYGLPNPHTDQPALVIGCGRQAIAPLIALKRSSPHPAPFTIYVQDPRCDPRAFNRVVCPEHDGLTGLNVDTMIGSPNRITAAGLEHAAQNFKAQLAQRPGPRVAMLIGGPSKTHTLTPDDHVAHISFAKALLSEGKSVLVTTSRRTPDWALKDYESLAAKQSQMWLHSGADPTPNPYLAFLGVADAVVVTQDSTNMLTEACATGKPVFSLPMTVRNPRRGPTKFDILYKALAARCGLAPFTGDIRAALYPPLGETTRIAAQIWDHFDARNTA